MKMVEAGEDIDISDEEPESLTADEYERIMEEPDREFEENGDSSPGEAMAHYFFQKAMESGYNRQQAFIAYYTVKGYGLQDMAELATIGLSESYITQIRKDMSEKWFGFFRLSNYSLKGSFPAGTGEYEQSVRFTINQRSF